MTFGSFDQICNKVPFPICLVISTGYNETFSEAYLPQCYARPVEIANTLIFQVGNAFVHFGSLAVLLMIIFNVRSKYTAIGRVEMLHFFYLCIGLIILTLITDCGVSPPSSESYAYFVAVQMGIALACCVTLLYNGVLFFQFWEDGLKTSMSLLRGISVAWFAVNFILSLFTFKGWGSLKPTETVGVFIVLYVVNAAILAAFVVVAAVLVVFALDSYWPLGTILLGVFFFVMGQILLYVLSNIICTHLKHYIDGTFFGSLCNIFAIMMVYKFWDLITTEDLEFSVATADYGVGLMDGDEKRHSTFFVQ